MFNKPKFFLDTSVCIDVAREKVISGGDWARTWDKCKTRFHYCISPVTTYELVVGLAESDEAHFIERRKAIHVLYPPGPKSFLDQLSVFVPNTIFGEKQRPADSVDTDFDLWIRAILRSPNKKALQSGKLRIGLKGRGGFGLDLDSIRKSIRDIQAGYARLFHSFRKTGVPELTPDFWAKMILKDLRRPLTPPNVTLVLERLDAAYQFHRRLWQFIRNSGYDFSKHGGEIVDAQQLYYLCQPDIYFVTNEARLKKAVSGSPQGRRVLTYQDLSDCCAQPAP